MTSVLYSPLSSGFLQVDLAYTALALPKQVLARHGLTLVWYCSLAIQSHTANYDSGSMFYIELLITW